MPNYRSLNHTKWTCQYHVVFIPKYRKKAIYGGIAAELGRRVPPSGQAARKRGGRRPLAGGPCPHHVVDPAEIFGRASSHCPGVRGAAAQFRRAALLGPGLFCFDGRSGRRSDPGIYSPSGARRSAHRSDESDVIYVPFRGRKGSRSDPVMPLRAARKIKPLAKPGDTYFFL